jgi:hypothetical protein
MSTVKPVTTPNALATRKRRMLTLKESLGACLTYSIPIVVIALGAGTWFWAFFGGKGMSATQTSDVMSLGAGILGGGIVSMAAVWIAQRLSEQQKLLVDRFQISLQSNLTGLDIRAKDLRGIYLSGKDLAFARLTDCCLDNAVLVGASLRSADLSGASIRDASLMDARLDEAYLTGACLDGSNLVDAVFTQATLIGASFRNTSVTGAVFDGADASGADFRGSSITPAQLKEFMTKPDFT